MAGEVVEISFRAVKGDVMYEQLQDAPGLAIQSVSAEEYDPSAWAVGAPMKTVAPAADDVALADPPAHS